MHVDNSYTFEFYQPDVIKEMFNTIKGSYEAGVYKVSGIFRLIND